MANPRFQPTYTTDDIWVGTNQNECLTDTLEEMQAETQGKAPAAHGHSEYALVNHSHEQYALAAHNHDGTYAPLTHNHNALYAALGHTHPPTPVTTPNADLDDFTTTGAYSFANAYQPINRPTGTSNGWLVVISWSPNPATLTIKQFWLRHGTVGVNDHCVYVRTRVGDYGWSSWAQLMTDKDLQPSVLWSGSLYLNATQTVTPSKKLSECRNGWLLLWSDYDTETATANDADFVTTTIPKLNPTGGNWSGKMFLCDVPRFYGSDLEDTATEKRIMKVVYIHDDKIVGHTANNKGTRKDVVLRAVYEW